MKLISHFISKYGTSLLVVAALFIFYPGIFLARGAWLTCDHAEQHFPWAYYLAEELKAGRFPFWTGLIHSGFPLAAEGQIGIFYPPNLLFSVLLPIRQGYAWNFVAHQLLSGFFMFAYLRSLKLGRESACYGTLIYLFSTLLGGGYYNLTSLKVLTWFPAALLLIEKMAAGISFRKWQPFLLGGLFFLQINAGYLQVAVYAVGFSFLYLALRFFWFQKISFKRILELGSIAAVSLGITLLLSAPQLWLTFQLSLQSNRLNPAESYAYIGSYSPLAFLSLFFRELEPLFGTKLYLGIFPIFLVCVAFCRQRKGEIIFFSILGALALLLALGQFSPLYVFLVKFFHFSSFRTPAKFLFFFGFFLTVLAAFGIDRILNEENKERLLKNTKVFFVILLFSLFCLVIGWLAVSVFQGTVYSIGENLLQKYFYGKPGHPHDWEFYRVKLMNYLELAGSVLNPFSRSSVQALLRILASLLLIVWLLAGNVRKILFYALAAAILLVDLFGFHFAAGNYSAYQDYYAPSGVTAFLKGHLGDSRYFNYSNKLSSAPLPVSKNMLYKLRSANAYSPLVSKQYYDFFGALGGIDDSSGARTPQDEYLYGHLNQLNLLSVKYLVTDRSLQSPALKEVYSEGKWRIYENLEVMPRFQLIPAYQSFTDSKDLSLALETNAFDPKEVVGLIGRPTVYYGQAGKALRNQIRVVAERAEHITLEVESKTDQILLISQLFYPGWMVKVDQKKAVLIPADWVISALPVRAGKHQVELSFSPEFFARQKGK